MLAERLPHSHVRDIKPTLSLIAQNLERHRVGNGKGEELEIKCCLQQGSEHACTSDRRQE